MKHCPSIKLKNIRRFLSIFTFRNCRCHSACCTMELDHNEINNYTPRKRSVSAPTILENTQHRKLPPLPKKKNI